jgi:hypothetical protein
MKARRLGASTFVVGAIAIATGLSIARPSAADIADVPGGGPIAAPPSPSSFAGAFGWAATRRTLRESPDPRARAAAIVRAATLGTDEAWREIEEAAGVAPFGDDPDAALVVRLAAARALAKSPRKEQARLALERLFDTPEPAGRLAPRTDGRPRAADPELRRWLRETAAFALARLDAHDVLLRHAGVSDPSRDEKSAAALAALRAAPPSRLTEQAVRADGTVPPDAVPIFTQLADPRGADTLLRVAKAPNRGRADALVALGRMGDARVAVIARTLLGADAEPREREAAIDALAELGDPSVGAAIVELAKGSRRDDAATALRLAIAWPSAAVVPVLAPRAAEGDAQALAALGASGPLGAAALGRLALDKASGEVGELAALDLAVLDGEGGTRALDALADAGRTAGGVLLRRSLRAALVRRGALGLDVRGAAEASAMALASKQAADRVLGAALRAAGSLDAASALFASSDLSARRGAVIGLGAHRGSDAAALARRWLRDEPTLDDELAAAIAAVAAREVDGSAARDVPVSNERLARWLAEDRSAAPLAAFVLAARASASDGRTEVPGDRPADGGRAEGLDAALTSPSFATRLGAVAGLAASKSERATGRLIAMLARAGQPQLRRALVRALAIRGDVAGKPLRAELALADPDATVRSLAVAALEGTSSWPRGREVVRARAATADPNATARVMLHVEGGVAAPALADAEGWVFVFGVPSGRGRLEAFVDASSAPGPR